MEKRKKSETLHVRVSKEMKQEMDKKRAEILSISELTRELYRMWLDGETVVRKEINL